MVMGTRTAMEMRKERARDPSRVEAIDHEFDGA
jgi:hypothetical protein